MCSNKELLMDRYNLVSLLGIFGLMGIAWALSSNRRRVNVRVIVWGVFYQGGLAILQTGK
jgi:nucleoside permease NupC